MITFDETINLDDMSSRNQNENLVDAEHSDAFGNESSPTESQNKAAKRWKLLKNVVRFTSRRSSLTVEEEKLLNAIDKKQPTAPIEKDGTERQRLRHSIHVMKNGLTEAEMSFLENLVDNDEIDAPYLEHANQVLTTDPLYKDEEQSKEFSKEFEKAKPQQQQRRDSCFRRETWEYYLNSSDEYRASLTPKKIHERKNLLPEESFVPQHPEKKELSFFDKLFGKREEEDIEEKKLEEEPDLLPPPPPQPPPLILATSATDDDCTPHVMSPPIMDALRPHLPFAIQEDNFWLKYSMVRDGASMRSLLHQVRSSARTILAIETMQGDVFGAFTSSPWRPQGHEYYGSGEAFVWRLASCRRDYTSNVEEQIQLESQLEVFPWSGQNDNVQSLVNNLDAPIVIGGGGPANDPFAQEKSKGIAIMLEPTLLRGTSDPSVTFDNPSLPVSSENEFFEIANIEVWTMTPVESLTQAEKLELGRQFVFHHFSER